MNLVPKLIWCICGVSFGCKEPRDFLFMHFLGGAEKAPCKARKIFIGVKLTNVRAHYHASKLDRALSGIKI